MASQEVPKTCKVILADTIAKKLLGEVKESFVQVQGENGPKPTLAAFLANDDPSAAQYAEWSKKTCEEK
jgi:methylenetetrahydrofolate dehydrogenase (NAD+)